MKRELFGFENQLKKGDMVAYRSIRDPDCPDHHRDGHQARIMEVETDSIDKDLFPFRIAYLIRFCDDQRETWCRVDEITRV